MSSSPSFFGAASSIGKRESQQDEYLVVEDLFEGTTPRTSLFAVFDGHGSDGAKVSSYAKKMFPKVLREHRTALIGRPKEAAVALTQAFATVHATLKDNPAIDCYMSGTTAVVMLFFEVERRVLIGNVGDSRVILGRKEGDAIVPMRVSTDHTCANPVELERVQAAGARIDHMPSENGGEGPLRLYKGTLPYPGLVVTRSIGDTCAERIGVLCEPEIIERELSKKDKYFVLGSDGLWDGLDLDEVIRLVVKYEPAQKASEVLVKRALKSLDSKSIDDNVTAVVVYTG